MKFRWLLISIFLVPLITLPAQAQQILFTPENGFSGPSQGNGSLRLFLGHRRAFHVRSLGKIQNDGSFTLDQTITFDGKINQTRSWTIYHVSPLHYTGTLSDAAGPVSGHTSGRVLFLKYRVKGPFVMHQILTLMSDGKTIDNVGRITLLGIPVGFMHEIIRRDE